MKSTFDRKLEDPNFRREYFLSKAKTIVDEDLTVEDIAELLEIKYLLSKGLLV